MKVRHHCGVWLEDWFRVTDAAAELGITSRHVRTLIQQGALQARRLSPRLYLVQRQSVEHYKQVRRPPGRPPQAGGRSKS